LAISSAHYSHGPILELDLSGGEKASGPHVFSWNGQGEAGSGVLKDGLINPLFSPYDVTLRSESGLEDQAEFHVFYHSITLEHGTYTADSKAPDKDAEPTKWLQFQLSDLGYFSGPVDGVLGKQTRRAIARYSRAIPGVKETSTANDVVRGHLEGGHGRREILEGAMPKSGERARAFLDHDYYYRGRFSYADDFQPNRHEKQAQEKLDRYEMPVEAVVLLVSKNDPDGTGTGVEAGAASGHAKIEFQVLDPPEDVSVLPTHTELIPSDGRAYVEKVLALKAGAPGSDDDRKDNCPFLFHGVRNLGGAGPDHFRVGSSLEPFVSHAKGKNCVAEVHHQPDKSPHKLGRCGVLFRASYIGGDSYVIKAKMSRHRPIDWNEVRDQFAYAHLEFVTSAPKATVSGFLATDVDKTGYIDLVRKHHTSLGPEDLIFDDETMYTPKDIPPQGADEPGTAYELKVRSKVSSFIDANDHQFLRDFGFWMRERAEATRPPGVVVAAAVPAVPSFPFPSRRVTSCSNQ
ncbi:peptidoglycan-binding protein, partial [Desulfobulbus sp. AH-315-M07]|nr:peptidoglycan-binding protein [Desulfobulbus sp. AH-315-M07]